MPGHKGIDRTPDANFDWTLDWSSELTGSTGFKDYQPLKTAFPPIPEYAIPTSNPRRAMITVFLMVSRTRGSCEWIIGEDGVIRLITTCNVTHCQYTHTPAKLIKEIQTKLSTYNVMPLAKMNLL